jgi:hypothetical protein
VRVARRALLAPLMLAVALVSAAFGYGPAEALLLWLEDRW